MAQTSILGRIGQLVRANVNAMLDEAEDPEKMLDQLIRDFTNNIAEAEEAVAQTDRQPPAPRGRRPRGPRGLRRVAEPRPRPPRIAPRRSAPRATPPRPTASTVSPSSRSGARSRSRSRSGPSTPRSRQQTELTDKLKDGLNKLRVKREELVQKRDELVSRAKMAQAQMQVQQTLKEVSVLDPTSELNRFEERIRRQEALARGMEEVAASSLEDQFAELESDEEELEVEVRLAELKGKRWARERRRSARAGPGPEIPPASTWKGPRPRPLLHARPPALPGCALRRGRASASMTNR